MKMESTCPSETTRRYILQNMTLHNYLCEILKSHKCLHTFNRIYSGELYAVSQDLFIRRQLQQRHVPCDISLSASQSFNKAFRSLFAFSTKNATSLTQETRFFRWFPGETGLPGNEASCVTKQEQRISPSPCFIFLVRRVKLYIGHHIESSEPFFSYSRRAAAHRGHLLRRGLTPTCTLCAMALIDTDHFVMQEAVPSILTRCSYHWR
jgi:hypothetical protein